MLHFHLIFILAYLSGWFTVFTVYFPLLVGFFFFLSYKFLFFVVAFLFHLQEIFQYFFQDWFNIDELQLDFACLRRSFFLQFWKITLLDRIAEVVGFSFLAS